VSRWANNRVGGVYKERNGVQQASILFTYLNGPDTDNLNEKILSAALQLGEESMSQEGTDPGFWATPLVKENGQWRMVVDRRGEGEI